MIGNAITGNNTDNAITGNDNTNNAIIGHDNTDNSTTGRDNTDDATTSDGNMDNSVTGKVSTVCIVHQQDRLLSYQLCPTFPPVVEGMRLTEP